jgi:hypothetical protein
MLVSDALRRTPPAFTMGWFILPLILVVVEVVWKRMRMKNLNKSLESWNRVQAGKPTNKISPLE